MRSASTGRAESDVPAAVAADHAAAARLPIPFPFPGRPRRRRRLPIPGTRGYPPTGGSGRRRHVAGGGDDRVNVMALREITDDSGGRTEIVRDARDLDPAVAEHRR